MLRSIIPYKYTKAKKVFAIFTFVLSANRLIFPFTMLTRILFFSFLLRKYKDFRSVF